RGGGWGEGWGEARGDGRDAWHCVSRVACRVCEAREVGSGAQERKRIRESNAWFYVDRASHRRSDHRYSRRHPVPRLLPGAGEGAGGELSLQRQADRHGVLDV